MQRSACPFSVNDDDILFDISTQRMKQQNIQITIVGLVNQ